MKKDAYYFPHFSNARHDRKLKRVIKDLGIEGYGIYFMVLEVLRDQQDFKYPLQDIDLLADEFGTSESKLSVVINNYDLFQVDTENNFFSMKQILYMQPYLEKTKRAKEAANTRWAKVNSTPNTMLPESGASQVYIIKCQRDGEDFIKVGLTAKSVNGRFNGKMPYDYDNLKHFICSDYKEASKLESEFMEVFKSWSYTPRLDFSGKKECFKIDAIEEILKYIPKESYETMHLHMQNNYLADARKVKESKVKESKVKEEKVLTARELIFEKWFKYKREKKQTYTPTGKETLVKTWASYSDSQLEQIVDTSIGNNWAGLFPPKNTFPVTTSNQPQAPRTTISIPDNY